MDTRSLYAAILKEIRRYKHIPACAWDQPGSRITASMSASTSCPTDKAPYIAQFVTFGLVAAYALAYNLGYAPNIAGSGLWLLGLEQLS